MADAPSIQCRLWRSSLSEHRRAWFRVKLPGGSKLRSCSCRARRLGRRGHHYHAVRRAPRERLCPRHGRGKSLKEQAQRSCQDGSVKSVAILAQVLFTRRHDLRQFACLALRSFRGHVALGRAWSLVPQAWSRREASRSRHRGAAKMARSSP